MAEEPCNPSPIGNPSALARRNWFQTKLVIFIGKHTPKCRDMVRILSQAMDQPLPLSMRINKRIHYLICCWCQRYEEQLRYIRDIAQDSNKSGPFQGAKAFFCNVTDTTENGNSVLTLSDDFKAPDAPDPHWQIVDSNGNAYLLQKLSIKGGKMNRKITVPKYVPDIAKVQFWCAFAEVNLGEAAFEQPVK